jgi:uncharacterized repeat protein (TIGR01451 family)
VQFTAIAGSTTIYSNPVNVVVAPPPSRAALTLLRSDAAGAEVLALATQCVSGGTTVVLPPPYASNGQSWPLGQPLPLGAAVIVHGGEAVFVEIFDADRNRDAAAVDLVEVTVGALGGDSETLVLEETAADSGRFLGYVQTRAGGAAVGDCVLDVQRDGDLTARYVDALDATDIATDAALVDPFGVVFDSQTGQPIDGARVRLVAAGSGAPAAVLGDDGQSAYPADMVTGQTVTDSGGTSYSLPPGVFRFPLVAAGDYQLVVEPPAGYRAPSTVPESRLQTLPGSPYALTPASFGNAMTIAGEIPQAIDIPLDPAAGALFLDKRAGLDVAAIGDFVPYTVTVRNVTAGAPLTNVVVTDYLPPGMRYQPGSARLDGTSPLEPEIGADGLTLTFQLPDLPAQRSASLRYVGVVATAAAGGTLVNRAIARADDGSESNAASAAVVLREELFTSSTLLLGRIRAGTCAASGDGTDGVPGVRVYLEDGRYAVTDDEGKYHFEGVTPGSHVVQLDPITLPADVEPLHCDNRVRSAGNALSQFVDMRGGALGTADFVVGHRAAPTGDVRFSLTTELTGDRFEHAATIGARGVPLVESEVVVLLPESFTYVPGSAARGGVGLPDPEAQSGSLRFRLGAVEADRPEHVTFATRAAGGAGSDHTVQAMLRFTTGLDRAERTEPVANVVRGDEAVVERVSYTFSPRYNAYSFAPTFKSLQTEVDPRDGAELDRIAAEWRGMRELTIRVIGHSDRTPIAARNRGRFPDNYALSAARAQAVANYLQTAFPDARIEVEGRGADEPLSDGTDADSLSRNRRVEIEFQGVRAVSAANWRVVTPSADSPTVTTTGSFEGDVAVQRPAIASSRPNGTVAALEPEIDVASVEPEVAMLQPSEGFAPPVPTVHVTIAHLPGQAVRLAVNGRPVDELAFDGTKMNSAKTAALSRWRGVDLAEGDNVIVATVVDAAGDETVLARTVRYGGGAVRAELVAEESQLTADGRTQPLIALRVFDAAGEPARPGTLGAYRVDAPYRTWWEVETLHDNPLIVESRREPTFSVEEDGLVRILLEPTTESGTAIVRLRFNERQEQEIRAWLEPEQRDWILVGIAETTTAYTNLEAALEPPDIEDGYTGDGRLAFFAKGRIKGSSLLTIAFDSERDRPLVEDRLFGAIEPDRYYTLYGDAVEQRFEASTTRKLYLKIERRQFAALFGDFETGLTITELSRYSRTLTGLKADFAGERFAVNAFAAENRERYGRDEFVGDGTSGPYRLSRTPLVANSDRLHIEVRDRVRSEVVVESRVLARFIDYSIDYYTGELTFKQPISSRDSDFNPVFIVAEYETLLVEAGGTTAGARASARLSDTVELGATLIDEGSLVGGSRLAGTDLTFRPTGALEVRAELAQTASDHMNRASAYLAEIEHVTERLDLAAYVREQETGFGVGQQLRTESGTRKVGIDARSTLTDLWSARGETFRQSNLATGADRELASAEARRETDDATASIGVKRVVDDLPQSGIQESQLLSLGGSLDVLRDRVTLRALTEQSLGDPAASLDFPERTALGLDYHLTSATTLFAEVEDAEGELIDSTMTRVGVRSTPWSGSQLQSSMNREIGEYGPRVFANVGLTQAFTLGEAWAMDFGIDRTDTVTGVDAERFNANVPLVSGAMGGDFTATYVGAQYRTDVWTITTRIERRDSDTDHRRSLTSGFFREPLSGRALSVTTRWLSNETATGDGRIVDARVSYAYRPSEGRFIVLERLDLVQDERDDLLTSFETARIVNNVNLHWQIGQLFEFGTQIGARYAKSTIEGERYSGWSKLLGFDARRELRPKLDVGGHATWLDAEAAGTTQRALGFDFGINASRNVWISIGYNFEGFSDDQFDAARYTAQGPYVRFRMKVDQDSFKDLDLARLRPNNGADSRSAAATPEPPGTTPP